jgi:hypothetical protein
LRAWQDRRYWSLVVFHTIEHNETTAANDVFYDGDYEAYLELMSEMCREEGIEIWNYCLMPNPVVHHGKNPSRAICTNKKMNELGNAVQEIGDVRIFVSMITNVA